MTKATLSKGAIGAVQLVKRTINETLDWWWSKRTEWTERIEKRFWSTWKRTGSDSNKSARRWMNDQEEKVNEKEDDEFFLQRCRNQAESNKGFDLICRTKRKMKMKMKKREVRAGRVGRRRLKWWTSAEQEREGRRWTPNERLRTPISITTTPAKVIRTEKPSVSMSEAIAGNRHRQRDERGRRRCMRGWARKTIRMQN